MSTLGETPSFAAKLESRLEFETLVSDRSSRFINLHADDVLPRIENAIRHVCEFLGIELAVLWQWSIAAPDVIVPTHVYYAQKGPRSAEPMREEQYPWARQQLLAGRTIAISSLEQLPAEAAVDRATCLAYGIKSVLCLPLSLGGEPPVGGLGPECVVDGARLANALVQRLQLVAQIFTNALARGRRERRLQDNERRLAAGAELAGLAFYEVDFGVGAMYVGDRLCDLLGVPADRDHGLQVLEYWKERLHPEDRPRCCTSVSCCIPGIWNNSPASIVSSIQPVGRGGFITSAASPAVMQRDGRSNRSAPSATSRSPSKPRKRSSI